MTPHRLHSKYFVHDPDAVDLPALVPVFHRWIRERLVDELLIDVADYKHVHQGPGIMLIGHEADYALDGAEGRHGLLYSRKRQLPGTLRSAVRLVLQQGVYACRLLETDPALEDRLTFRVDEVEIALVDRLALPNRPGALDAVRDDLHAALTGVYGDGAIHLTQADADPRRPLTVHAHLPDAPDLATLAARLHPATA